MVPFSKSSYPTSLCDLAHAQDHALTLVSLGTVGTGVLSLLHVLALRRSEKEVFAAIPIVGDQHSKGEEVADETTDVAVRVPGLVHLSGVETGWDCVDAHRATLGVDMEDVPGLEATQYVPVARVHALARCLVRDRGLRIRPTRDTVAAGAVLGRSAGVGVGGAIVVMILGIVAQGRDRETNLSATSSYKRRQIVWQIFDRCIYKDLCKVMKW